MRATYKYPIDPLGPLAHIDLTTGGVIDFYDGDVTLTHSGNTLTLAGATTGYVFNTGPTSILIPTQTIAGAGSITSCMGQIIRVTAAGTTTLPAGTVVGQTVTVVSTTAAAVSVDCASTSDYIILSGTALAAGNKITSDSTIGAAVTLVNEIANYWRAFVNQGTWSDGGA